MTNPPAVCTSESDPLQVSWVPDLPTTGALGLAHAPGMRGPNGAGTIDWQRDLDADLERLRHHHGADMLASLLEPQEFDLLGVPDLLERARDAGLEVRHFPIIDAWYPRPHEDDGFDAFVAGVRAALDDGRRVVAHCRGGIGRSGLLAACLASTYGLDARSAIERVRRARPGAVETRPQEGYVARFAERFAARAEAARHG